MGKTKANDGGKRSRRLVIIGGGVDKQGPVLHEVARYVNNGKLVIATVAAEDSAKSFETYKRAFSKLGLPQPAELSIDSRADANDEDRLKVLDEATGVFFTGGDQLRITSQIGDTPIERRLREIYEAGGMIAGTSAGASAMCGTMLVSGSGNESRRPDSLRLAPGLGYIRGVIVDQHFAQRGRMARLIGAVALNPRELGIGIDEDTAIVVEEGKSFFVMGSGAVYVVDASGVTQSNIADDLEPGAALSIYDVRLHVLAKGDAFDLREQRPNAASRRVKEMLASVEWTSDREDAEAGEREESKENSEENSKEKDRGAAESQARESAA